MSTQRHQFAIPGRATTHRPGASVMVLIITAALLAGALLPACAQGPEAYGAPHLFSLPTATTARQFGMGGVSTSLEDIGFPNPAFAGMLSSPRAGLRVACTEFDGDGMSLTGTQAWYATPTGEGEGMQFLGFRLDSDRGAITTPAGPLPGSIEETDLAVHYGRRLSDQWLLGIGFSPVLKAETRLFNPVDGSVLSFAESEAQIGGRLGALYNYQPDGFIGLVFDWYTEDVRFQAPPMLAPAKFDFTSTEWALGASKRITDKVTAAIEWMELKSEDSAYSSKSEGLHLGVEVEAAPGIAVRAGSNDGSLSLGAGFRRDEWVANYAFTSDWNDDAVGSAFGGSQTHQVEIGGYW